MERQQPPGTASLAAALELRDHDASTDPPVSSPYRQLDAR